MENRHGVGKLGHEGRQVFLLVPCGHCAQVAEEGTNSKEFHRNTIKIKDLSTKEIEQFLERHSLCSDFYGPI